MTTFACRRREDQAALRVLEAHSCRLPFLDRQYAPPRPIDKIRGALEDASRDETAEAIARGFPTVPLVGLSANVGAAGRNAGAEVATTPYVAFSDDDMWWDPGALRHGADLLDRHAALALLAARILVEPGGREDPACAIMAASPLPRPPALPGIPVLGFIAGASIARRHAFLSVGGYEPRFFLGGEERLVACDLAAAGWALAYVPEIGAHHRPSPRRDAPARRVLRERNALWFAWLRRAAQVALAATARAMAAAASEGPSRRGLRQALGGLTWALSHRRPLPATSRRGCVNSATERRLLHRLDEIVWEEPGARRRSACGRGLTGEAVSGTRSERAHRQATRRPTLGTRARSMTSRARRHGRGMRRSSDRGCSLARAYRS